MTPPKLPDIPGLKKLAPLETNAVHFDKRHTVLTPDVLASIQKPAPGQKPAPVKKE